MGPFMVWFLAFAMVAAVPTGLVWAARAIGGPAYLFQGLADRATQCVMALGLAGSAAVVIHQFAGAFGTVVLGL